MTNKELHEEIICIGNELKELEAKSGRLEAKLEELKKATSDSRGVFRPKYGEEYWNIENDGGVYSEVWENFNFDVDVYSIGNCFPTEEAAKDTVRTLRLIQKARESQDGFVPDWENWGQCKYYLCFDKGYLDIKASTSLNTAPTFGFWGDKSICEQFASENHHELIWFFKEYVR